MTTSRIRRGLTARATLTALALAAGLAAAAPAAAQEDGARVRHGHLARAEAPPPLTVRRRPAPVPLGPIVAEDGYYDVGGLFRRWDDPRLTTFWGWRLGGDNFYGDQAGDPITRGNAGLGMIAGYGPAMGGYGGPHFDAVGGFHNGPWPLAQESADYATGSIWQPRYDRPPPRYPSLKQQVAELNTGLGGTGQVVRVKSSHERWAEAYRAAAERTEPTVAEPIFDPFDF